MIVKLIKVNAWLALAYGISCLIAAPQITNLALTCLGVDENRIVQNETYLVAMSFVRIAGLLLLTHALVIWFVVKLGVNADEPRPLLTILSIGLLLWGGMLLFLISTKCPVLCFAAVLGLLEWLLIPLLFLFTYKRTSDWKAVRPSE